MISQHCHDETGEAPQLASADQRLCTFIIDMFALYLLSFIVALILVITATVFGLEIEPDDLNPGAIGLTIFLVYYVLQEAWFGKTLGKLIMRTKVVGIDGPDLTFGQALARTLCRLIPFEIFSFLSGRPRGWHDRIPGTMVVSTRKR